MKLKIKICPTCESKNFRRKTAPIAHGRVVVPKATFWECDDCGEQAYSLEDMDRIEAYVRTKSEPKAA